MLVHYSHKKKTDTDFLLTPIFFLPRSRWQTCLFIRDESSARFQPTIPYVAVLLLHIEQQDTPVNRIANQLDLARMIALAMPAAFLFLFRELEYRLAAQLLEVHFSDRPGWRRRRRTKLT